MFDKIVEKMLEITDDKMALAGSYAKFSGEGYKPFKIDVKNFHQIEKTGLNKRIAFVDGGSSEIIGSANFSLNLVRVCYVVYENGKKISAKKSEALAFAQAATQNGEIHYKTSFFSTANSIGMDEISFSSFDRTLMLGINRAEIGSVANAVRRFAELRVAKSVADDKTSDIIVLDGNLHGTLTNENEYLDDLYESCGKNSIILAALSKTTSLFTDNGNLLSAVLGSISPLNSWFYHPIAEINNPSHKAEMFFAKFHPKSRHVFRLEIFNMQKAKAEEAINELAGNCTDPVFIGYPYGLVEADRIARVSNHEKESLKTMLMVKLKNKNVEKYLSSVNAHEILDRMSF